jgi:hypothetical protein
MSEIWRGGSMSLNYHSLVVADTRIAHLYGQKAFGGYRLRMSMELLPNAGSALHLGIEISNLAALVSCAGPTGPMRYLGRAYPEVPLRVRNQAYPQIHSILFDIDQTPALLAALERSRAGGELKFSVDLVGEGVQNGTWIPVKDTLTYISHISEWSRVLNEFGYAELLVFGVLIPQAPQGDRFRAAGELLRRAYEDLVNGRNDDVVSRTRKLIEHVWVANETTMAATGAAVAKYNSTERKKMTKLERALFVQEAVRHYAHPAHHVEASGSESWYSSTDAAFTLALASAVLSEALTHCAGDEAV